MFSIDLLWLDADCMGAYNANYSEVVREKRLIEKDVFGESIHRKSSLKSSEATAEESHTILWASRPARDCPL